MFAFFIAMNTMWISQSNRKKKAENDQNYITNKDNKTQCMQTWSQLILTKEKNDSEKND